MNDEVTAKIASLQADYTAIRGLPFQHFFCPVLYRDEDVQLCKGHVLNQAFGVPTNKWTVQRADVDSFFGSRFEADVTKLRYRESLGTDDVLSDPHLRRELRPRVYADEREILTFIPHGEIPAHFTPVHANEAGLPPVIGLKIRPEELDNVLEADWRIEVELDIRVGALVSLLKAAHLTQFYHLGYRWVFSPAGHLIGNTLLGRLFDACEGLSRSEAREVAERELAGYVNMVRPLLRTELNLQGTIVDGQVLVGWAASGFPWATIVIVPVGDTMHGVMLPVADDVQGFDVWDGFMKNSNESIKVKLAKFERSGEGSAWRFSSQTWRIDWPKGATLFGGCPGSVISI